MNKSEGTSSILLQIIQELNKFKTIQNFSFALGGGTNLALRYNHRISKDLDLFCPDIIGFKGYKAIERELKDLFGQNVFSITYPLNETDQFVFLRALIKKENETIKLELIQNTKNTKPIEETRGIKMISEFDIGIMKLYALSDRMSKKDVYDLDYITENIRLQDLFEGLRIKQETYKLDNEKSIFELNKKANPINDPDLLIKFDTGSYLLNKNKPGHSEDSLNIIKGNKNWHSARMSWRMKVRELFRSLNLKFPKNKGKKI